MWANILLGNPSTYTCSWHKFKVDKLLHWTTVLGSKLLLSTLLWWDNGSVFRFLIGHLIFKVSSSRTRVSKKNKSSSTQAQLWFACSLILLKSSFCIFSLKLLQGHWHNQLLLGGVYVFTVFQTIHLCVCVCVCVSRVVFSLQCSF